MGAAKTAENFGDSRGDADVVTELVDRTEMGRLLSVGTSCRRHWWGPASATVSGNLIPKGLNSQWAIAQQRH